MVSQFVLPKSEVQFDHEKFSLGDQRWGVAEVNRPCQIWVVHENFSGIKLFNSRGLGKAIIIKNTFLSSYFVKIILSVVLTDTWFISAAEVPDDSIITQSFLWKYLTICWYFYSKLTEIPWEKCLVWLIVFKQYTYTHNWKSTTGNCLQKKFWNLENPFPALVLYLKLSQHFAQQIDRKFKSFYPVFSADCFSTIKCNRNELVFHRRLIKWRQIHELKNI